MSFNQLEEGTGARIRYRRSPRQTGDEVPPDKIVRGYEVSKGQYVTSSTTSSSRCGRRASHTIEIEDFVDLDEIDPLYFEQPYYLSPTSAA